MYSDLNYYKYMSNLNIYPNSNLSLISILTLNWILNLKIPFHFSPEYVRTIPTLFWMFQQI